MRITKLTTFVVQPRWLFLKIETDAGVTGWGEPVVEGRAETVAACVAGAGVVAPCVGAAVCPPPVLQAAASNATTASAPQVRRVRKICSSSAPRLEPPVPPCFRLIHRAP